MVTHLCLNQPQRHNSPPCHISKCIVFVLVLLLFSLAFFQKDKNTWNVVVLVFIVVAERNFKHFFLGEKIPHKNIPNRGVWHAREKLAEVTPGRERSAFFLLSYAYFPLIFRGCFPFFLSKFVPKIFGICVFAQRFSHFFPRGEKLSRTFFGASCFPPTEKKILKNFEFFRSFYKKNSDHLEEKTCKV